MQKMVEVPISLIGKMSKATKAFEELESELEDFLLSKDAGFIEKMRKARKAHVSEKTSPLSKLKKDLCKEGFSCPT